MSPLRRCFPLDERQSAAELDAVLQHHHNLQEKLAEDMLNLARNLKNNTLAAQNIIKQDNQVGGQIYGINNSQIWCKTVFESVFVEKKSLMADLFPDEEVEKNSPFNLHL